VRYGAVVELEIEAGGMRMRVDGEAGRCGYRAPYVASGRFAAARC
jgi:hypothetical protein